MFRILIAIIVLSLGLVNVPEVSAQYQYNPSRNNGQRYCYNPNCRMCNMIWGPMQGYELTSDYQSVPTRRVQPQIVQSAPVVQNTTPRVETPPPTKSKEDADLELLATPQNVVEVMLSLVKPTSDDWVFDLGAGDGRIVITAAKVYGAKGVGIELNHDSAVKAETNVQNQGLSNRVIIIEGNILDYTYDNADIITLYLYPDLIEKVVPRIKPGVTVISANHDIPGVETEKKVVEIDGVEYEFFIWRS